MRNRFLDNQIGTGTARRSVVATPEGNIVVDHSRGVVGSFNGPTTETEIMPIGRWAEVRGRAMGQACGGGNLQTHFRIEYDANSGFSLIDEYGPNGITWTASGAGTAADPWSAWLRAPNATRHHFSSLRSVPNAANWPVGCSGIRASGSTSSGRSGERSGGGCGSGSGNTSGRRG